MATWATQRDPGLGFPVTLLPQNTHYNGRRVLYVLGFARRRLGGGNSLDRNVSEPLKLAQVVDELRHLSRRILSACDKP
jgi:hypothetical protein